MKRFFPFLLIFCSCEWAGTDMQTGQLTGFVPVYAARDVVSAIANEPARTTVRPGKIYAYGTYLFQVEQYEGIHIVDNNNPKQAKKVAFLKVPMATEIAIKSGHLYTNNVNDLVVFDLAKVTQPQLVNRIKDAFPVLDQTHPPVTNTYFECPDPSKGIVVAWEQKAIVNPKCRR